MSRDRSCTTHDDVVDGNVDQLDGIPDESHDYQAHEYRLTDLYHFLAIRSGAAHEKVHRILVETEWRHPGRQSNYQPCFLGWVKGGEG